MAEQARERLKRMKSCGPRLLKASTQSSPEPGTRAFDQQVLAGFKGAVCAEKQVADDRNGCMDVSSDLAVPIDKVPELNVVPRQVLAQWTSSLCEHKAAEETADGFDKFAVPVFTAAAANKDNPTYRRKHSPAGGPRHIEIAFSLPDNAKQLTASLFGADPHSKNTIAQEQDDSKRGRCFWRQISMPNLQSTELGELREAYEWR